MAVKASHDVSITSMFLARRRHDDPKLFQCQNDLPGINTLEQNNIDIKGTLWIIKMKFQKTFSLKNFVYTIHVPNEKDAMTSRCLDRKEVWHATWRVHSTGPAWPVKTQDICFWHLAGRSAPTGLAIVHWIYPQISPVSVVKLFSTSQIWGSVGRGFPFWWFAGRLEGSLNRTMQIWSLLCMRKCVWAKAKPSALYICFNPWQSVFP